MKKVLSFAAILTLFFGLTACDSDNSTAELDTLYEAGCTTCDDIDTDSGCTTCDDIDTDSACTTCDDIDTGDN